MLSFKYLNKITGITLEKLGTVLDAVIGIDVEAVFSFMDDDLCTHQLADAGNMKSDIARDLLKINNCCMIKQVITRIDNEVNICFISNGETFTAVFTSPAIEATAVNIERLKMQMENITNTKALSLIHLLTEECILSNGIYHIEYARSA